MHSKRQYKTMDSVYQAHFMLLVIIFLLYISHQVVADSHSVVKFLPGFQGPLPFHLHTGYVGVDESEDVQLFYYFVESERNPKVDPIILWMTGGPGCSAFSALAYEIGPVFFEQVKYNGSLPTLILNSNSWTKRTNIIFLDLPVGSGFSYGRTTTASSSNDIQASKQAVEFLRKWFVSHPEFVSNPFYVGGDSYAGIFVAIVTQMISNGNEAGLEQSINLQGYIAGNPKTFPAEANFSIPFAHNMGLISDELYESLRRSCGFDYQKSDFDSAECFRGLESYEQCINGINNKQILGPYCGTDAPHLSRSLSDERRVFLDRIGETSLSEFQCRAKGRLLAAYWMNDENVQKALHIRKGTVGKWIRCSTDLAFETTIMDVRPYHANLSTKGYKSLVYSGDHDLLVPFQSTQTWIRGLNYSIIDDWRQWILDGQIAGYTRSYSNKMTFATVKGAGHTAPEFKPAECYAMVDRWLSDKPL